MTDQQHCNNSGIKRTVFFTDANFSRRKCPKAKGPAVQFSPTCDVTFIECIDLDEIGKSQLWYSDQEYKSMQLANARALRTLHLLLSSTSCDPNDARVLDILTGIENLLLIKEVKKCRTEYLHAVLDEQERQDDLGIVDPDRLARVSQQYSTRAVKRAQRIGLNQSR
mmetsp:Transcript_23040/g.49880  ORF Transcript_23040/g.49880 Transcript_23040/m.49880 type:complete len:167 (-) Transcript_23040:191-691(-)|eukprot:CAMPEP_0172319354 /NCGR_PEP_ID=MMETSP1058-20130122/37408_1 /TAXON_ID=83371 /ORGANISM="Detonula confervacea, Strain CCMP 353" /LENGTH=166 /DNA_ID=CAMNT_0013034375 /DNA_START=40 /DNA_END=540 /DNA_ORIENTATION=+